ncbi:MAG TPA: nuclear transport factor 2 family protein, partial [Gemmatimonadota bacterium]|nr:nuclear transport factor 2 family protein [Gemmatimonadota bacterium]
KAWLINGGTAIASLDSMRTYVKTQMDAVTSYNTKLDRTTVVLISPSSAFIRATYSATNSLKDGRTLQWKSNAHLTMLAELRGGTWKIVGIHGSAGSGVAVPK